MPSRQLWLEACLVLVGFGCTKPQFGTGDGGDPATDTSDSDAGVSTNFAELVEHACVGTREADSAAELWVEPGGSGDVYLTGSVSGTWSLKGANLTLSPGPFVLGLGEDLAFASAISVASFNPETASASTRAVCVYNEDFIVAGTCSGAVTFSDDPRDCGSGQAFVWRRARRLELFPADVTIEALSCNDGGVVFAGGSFLGTVTFPGGESLSSPAKTRTAWVGALDFADLTFEWVGVPVETESRSAVHSLSAGPPFYAGGEVEGAGAEAFATYVNAGGLSAFSYEITASRNYLHVSAVQLPSGSLFVAATFENDDAIPTGEIALLPDGSDTLTEGAAAVFLDDLVAAADRFYVLGRFDERVSFADTELEEEVDTVGGRPFVMAFSPDGDLEGMQALEGVVGISSASPRLSLAADDSMDPLRLYVAATMTDGTGCGHASETPPNAVISAYDVRW